MNSHLANRLKTLRVAARSQLQALPAEDNYRQFHPALSPMAWHVGHCFFAEAYWLQEVVFADDQHTARWHPLYFPERATKTERGAQIPKLQELRDWTQDIEDQNDKFWQTPAADHKLMRDDYLARFLIQHYAQHLETMAMVRQQALLAQADIPAAPARLEATHQTDQRLQIKGGGALIGSPGSTDSYDNELPAHERRVSDFSLAPRPVSNGQWLAFMQDGGYERPEFWSQTGLHWLAASGVRHPDHWRPHPAGGWYSPDPEESLDSADPVHGIGWHEAEAFALWAGARLPHEYEWEHAKRSDQLQADGSVWEWCANALHTYPGFTAFPYDGYSTPWTDGHHRVARGASRHTEPEIRRPSFRNFYPESHRHVFAGLRLAG